tara:strand:+ start:705 stop:1082 length:378 start_codon:yes stop_codon:yes gene_type:complete
MATRRKYIKLDGTLTNVDNTEEVALQLPVRTIGSGGEIYLLRSFYFIKTGGSAATHAPRLGESAAFSDGDVDERMGVPASGNNIQDVYAAEVPVKTDGTGKLYFRPGFNTAADNDADYAFFFESI